MNNIFNADFYISTRSFKMIKIAFDHRDLLDKLFKYNVFHGFFVIKSVNLMLVTGC